MASQFSSDGKYFAQLSIDGKLQIWETDKSSFQQEFTPDFHLTSPCTCLHFVQPSSTVNKNGSPRKKIRRNSLHASTPHIVSGTSSGLLFVYSIAKGNVDFSINSKTSQSISCLSWCEGQILYSAAEQTVQCWDLVNKSIKSKWKTGHEKLSCILALEGNERLLTASRNIKLWAVESREVLKIFTGHSSEVSIIQYINPSNSADDYCITGSKGDRLLSCWNLNQEHTEKNAVANFLMEDIATNVSLKIGADGSTNMAAVTRSGVVHVYRHTLNGKCSKPLKPKTTIQIASDTGQEKCLVTPIPIANAVFSEDLSLFICHGALTLITFETVVVSDYEKVQCLIRKDPRKAAPSEDHQASNIRTPVIDNNVHYSTPYSTVKAVAVKRKIEGAVEVPMEQRLENLTLNQLDAGSKVPKSDNLAQLLIQGLHSKDKQIMSSVLHAKDETVLKNTVKRLPITVIIPFVQELTSYIQGKTVTCNIGALWLKHIVKIHAGVLISNPEIMGLLVPALGTIENRLSLLNPMNSLKGRLDLLVSQVTNASNAQNTEHEPMLVFNDRDSSDSDMEEVAQSKSENEWQESSESDDEEEDEAHISIDSDEEVMLS